MNLFEGENTADYRVLLVYPRITTYKKNLRRVTPPLGLAYIAAVLEKENYRVSILDAALEGYDMIEPVDEELVVFGLSLDDIKKRIRAFSPHIVGITFPYSCQAKNVLDICRAVKEANRETKVAVGGIHASALPEMVLSENREIDFVIIGEGEHTFLELANALKENRPVSGIKGIAFRNGNDVQINQPRELIHDLDSLPFPARHLLDMEAYIKINTWHAPYARKQRVGNIMTSRGCPGICIYCSSNNFFGHKFRGRSINNIIREIEQMISDYKIEEIQFEDDNLTFDRERAMELFKRLKKLNLAWCTPNGVRIDRVDEEMLKLMKESGCYQITFGVESGNQHVSTDIIRKGIDLKKVKPTVDAAKKTGMLVHLFFMAGLPGETKAQMEETLNFARHANPDSASFSIATPLPGSEMYELCLAKGYLKKGFRFEDTIYRKANISTPDFTAKELEEFIDKANYKFNSSLIYRDPLKFIKKYKNFFLRKPLGIFKAFRKNA